MSNDPAMRKFTAKDRDFLIQAATDGVGVTDGGTYRKHARVLAIKLSEPFSVATEHGVMEAEEGDYLVTNHPDDDETSDIWPVAAARFEQTYERSA